MSSRFKLTPSSEHPGWWVLADTENNIVIRWEEHHFNDTQKISALDNAEITEHTTADLAQIMREMGDYIARHHGSIAFDTPFGFEYSEDDAELCLYRHKEPKWRIKLQDENTDIRKLADSLRKAAEYLKNDTKKINENGKRTKNSNITHQQRRCRLFKRTW